MAFRSVLSEAGRFGFLLMHDATLTGLNVPHWFLAALSLAPAALLAFKRKLRFTVRGLLITTTVIAAMLGLVVWAL